MIKIYKTLAASVSVLVAASAFAEPAPAGYVLIGSTSDATFYVGQITRSSNVARFVQISDQNKPIPFDSQYARSIKASNTIDCANRIFSYGNYELYAGYQATGKLIGSAVVGVNAPKMPPETIDKNSVNEAIMKTVCK